MDYKSFKKTLRGLHTLVSCKSLTTCAIPLFTYLWLVGDTLVNIQEIAENVGVHPATIRRQLVTLIRLRVISKYDRSRKGYRYRVHKIPDKTLNRHSSKVRITPSTTTSTNNTLDNLEELSSLDSLARLDTSSSKGSNAHSSKKSLKNMKPSPYAGTDTWKTVKPILLKYFPTRAVSASKLTKAQFDVLTDLVTTQGFDFKDYAEWFYNEKSDRLGFNWKIFLYNDMIDEYSTYAEMVLKNKKHLRTASEDAKARHAEGAKKTKEWIKKLREKEAKKGGTGDGTAS